MARVAPVILELGEAPPLRAKKRVEVRKAAPKLPPPPPEPNCSNDPRVENRAVLRVTAGEELQGNCSEDLADAHHEECQDFSPFNIRKYVSSVRSKDFAKCWPFPNKYLDFCLERGWKPKLPPFDTSSSYSSPKNLQEGTLPGKAAGSSNGPLNTLALKNSKEHEDPSKEGSMGCQGNTEKDKRDGQNRENEERINRVFEADGYEESIGDKLEAATCDGDLSRELCGQRSISEKSSGVCTGGEGGGEVACIVVEAPDLKDNISNSSCDQIVTCSDGEVHGPGAIKPPFHTLSTGGLTEAENGLDDSVSHKESEIQEIEGHLNSSTLLEQNNKISKEAQTKLYYLTENGTIVKYIQGNTSAGGDQTPQEYILPHLAVDQGTPNKSMNKGHLDETAIARFPKHKGTPAKVPNNKRGSIRKSLEAAILNPSTDQEEYVTLAGMENAEILEDTLMNNPSSDVIALQVCPVCRSFNSTSNTALNAHIDHCLSMVPSSAISHSKLERLGMKAQKKRSMADICAVAPVRTLEDLERTRFEQWALFNHNLDKNMPFSWGGKVGDVHRKSRTFVYRSSPAMAWKGSGDHKEPKGKRHILRNFESEEKQSKRYHVDEAERQHLGMELPVPEVQEQVGGNEPTLKSKPLSASEGTQLLDSINSLGSQKSTPILSRQKQPPFHPSRKALDRDQPLSLAKQTWKQKPTHCSNSKKGRSSSAAKFSRVGIHGMNAADGIHANDVPSNDNIHHSPDTSAEASAIRETSPPAAATPRETQSVSDPCGMDLYMADHNLETHYAIPIISHGADPLPPPIHFPRKKSIDETEHSYPKTPDIIYMASMNRDTPNHVSNPVSTCAHFLVSHPLSVGGDVDLPVHFPSSILVSSHDQELSPRVLRKPRAIDGHSDSFRLETNARSMSSHDFGFTSPVKVYETEDSMKYASFSPPLLRSQQSTCGYSNGLAWLQPIPISPTPPSVENIDQNYPSAEELSSRPNSFGSAEGASEPGVVHIFGSPVFKLMGKNVMLSNKLGLQSDPMETPAFQNMQRNMPMPMPMPGYLQWSECGKTMEGAVERRDHHSISQPLIFSDGNSIHNYPERQHHCNANRQSPVLSQGNPQSFVPIRNQGMLASQSPAVIGFPHPEDMESWRQKIPSSKNNRPSMTTTASAQTMHRVVNLSNPQNVETVLPKEHFIGGGDFGTSLTMYGSSCSSVPKDITWVGPSCLRTPYEQKGFCQASGGCSRSRHFGFFSDLQALEPNHHRQQPTGTLSDIVQSSAGPCSIWPMYPGSTVKRALENRNLQ